MRYHFPCWFWHAYVIIEIQIPRVGNNGSYIIKSNIGTFFLFNFTEAFLESNYSYAQK